MTLSTPEPTPPLTDDELEQRRKDLFRRVGELMDDLGDMTTERDALAVELETVKDARAAESDEYVRQLRALPGWCRACPPDCVSCLGPDCECYEHEAPDDPPATEGETDA